jgi:pimeloyl-ACP methyl ester carboxylesterase
VLLLHGQPGGARDWDRVVAALAGSVQTIAPNRPGWDRHSPAVGLAGNARAALAALDAEGVEQAIVVGHSLGAAIAVWAATLDPGRVTGLVLAAPAANRASLALFDHWLTLPVAGSLTSSASLAGLGLVLRTSPLRRRLAERSGLDERYLLSSGRDLLTPWARRAFVTEQRALVRDLPALEDRLEQVRAPTLILTGTEDRIVPGDAPRELAEQIRGAQLIEVEKAGHLLPQLHAQDLAQAILLAVSGAGTGYPA